MHFRLGGKMKKIEKQARAVRKTLGQLIKQIETLTKMILELEKKESKNMQNKKNSRPKIRKRILIPKPAKKKAFKKR